MKKLTSVWLIISMMIVLGITSIAQARTGGTSDGSSSKPRSANSSSFSSKPKKTTSATDSIFANIAKTNEAKKAWQERNKKIVDTPVARVPVPVQDDNANRRQEQQLNAIQKQIADAKRQQQIIAAAQTAAQLAINRRSPPAPVTPSTITTPIAETEPANSGGTSWFMMFLMLGAVVLVIVWFRKRNTTNTIYRL